MSRRPSIFHPGIQDSDKQSKISIFMNQLNSRIETYQIQVNPFKNRLYNFWANKFSVDSAKAWLPFGAYTYSKQEKQKALLALQTYMNQYNPENPKAGLPCPKDIMVLCDGTTKDFLLQYQDVLPQEFKLLAHQTANMGFKEYNFISAFINDVKNRWTPNA